MSSFEFPAHIALDDRGPQFRAVIISLLVIASVATALRCYTRAVLIKAWAQDDTWMVVALVFYALYSTFALIGVHYGDGKHLIALNLVQIGLIAKFSWISFIFYYLCVIFAKISVGTTFLRLTPRTVHTGVSTTVKVIMGIAVISGIVYMFIGIFQFLDIILPLAYLYGSFNALCDLIYGILPIFIVHKIQVKLSTKIMLVAIIGMAAISSITVFVRMAYFKEYRSLDPFHDVIDIAIWSTIEPGLAITAGSIATLTPLYRLIIGKLGFLTLRSSKSGNTPQSGNTGATKQSRPPVSGPFHKHSSSDYHKMEDLHSASVVSPIGVLDAPERGWPLVPDQSHYDENESQEHLNKRMPVPDLEKGVRR